MPTIAAMQVKLLPFSESLAQALFATLQDPALYEYIEDSPPTDFEAYRTRCKKLEHTYSPDGKERWLNWAVEFEARIVGYVQATVYETTESGARGAEFAYALHSSVWGKSVAFDSSIALLKILCEEFSVSDVWLTILHTNARSIQLAKRLGLTERPAADYPYTNFEAGDVVLHKQL